MDKRRIILVLIILVINLAITLKLLFVKYDIKNVDNNLIYFDVPNDYYMNNRYKLNDNTFKLYNKNNNSTVDILLLEQYPSNNTKYTQKKLSESIMYQIDKNIDKYKIKSIEEKNNTFSIKYENNNKIIETHFTFETSYVLVTIYTMYEKDYNKNDINKINSSIKVKK